MSQDQKSGAAPRALFVFLIIAIALNLRPFLAAPGPILPLIAQDTGLGYGALSLLTLLPMLLMGIGAFVAPTVLVHIGTRRGLLLALGLLFVGSLLRVSALNGIVLILTALLCGAGVALVQSIMPGLIKQNFPRHVVTLTGFYSAMIMIGGAVGAQVVPRLVQMGTPWQEALAWLAVPVIPAILVTCLVLSGTPAVRADRNLTSALLRRPRTWVLMAMFGLINSGYSSLIAWLAPYYQDNGWNSAESGSLISAMAISQGVGGFLVPFLARNSTDRRPWLWGLIIIQAVGFCGLAIAPLSLPYLWAVLCGLGLAGTFALGIVVALDHLENPAQAGTLAALMQGGGFLIATFPPFILARIHERSDSFAHGWIFHLVLIAIAAALIWRMDPRHYRKAFACGLQGESSGA